MTLDVGGVRHVTTSETLLSVPESRLAAAIEDALAHDPPRLSLRFDRNGNHFTYVLDYLRNGRLDKALSPHIVMALATEARFFGLDDLADEAKYIYPAREAKRLARHTPSFVVAYAHYAKQLALHGNPQEAEDRWEKLAPKLSAALFDTFNKQIIQAPTALDQAYANLCAAKCLLHQGSAERTDQALQMLDRAVGMAPRSYLVHLIASLWCSSIEARDGATGKFTELAFKYAQGAAQLDPECFRAHQQLASLHTRVKNYAGAAASYKVLTALKPYASRAYYDLARALMAERRYMEAHAAIKQAVARESNNADYYQVYGNALYSLGDMVASCRALRRAQALGNSSPHVQEVLAEVLVALRRFDEAEIEIDSALRDMPDEAMLYVVQAELYAATNRAHEAEQSLGLALQLDPHNANAFFELEKILRSQGRINEANFFYEQAHLRELAQRPARAGNRAIL